MAKENLLSFGHSESGVRFEDAVKMEQEHQKAVAAARIEPNENVFMVPPQGRTARAFTLGRAHPENIYEEELPV
jgi:hypothetical protein